MRRFSLAEIRRETNNFDESLIILTGGFGRIYRTHESVSVAICRLNFKSRNPSRFEMKIEVLLEVRHRNILSVIGYCSEEDEKILVYGDVLPLRTLGDHLYGDGAPLSWGQRLKICIGTARGLDYLHSGTNFENGVIHGDVTSENILLDENRLAKIGGFHEYTMFMDHEDDLFSGAMTGTPGYIDPACFYTGIMTRNADVYSFGVVLFQVLCGRKAIAEIVFGREQELEQERNLVKLAKKSVEEGNLKQIIDPSLHGEVVRVDEFINLAEECVDEDEEKRPKMRQVVSRLEGFLMSWELERGNVDDNINDSYYSSPDIRDFTIEEIKDAYYRKEVGTTDSDEKSGRKMTLTRKMTRYLLGRSGILRLGSATLRQKKPDHTFFDIESSPHVFSLTEVLLATNKFDTALTIGRDGFGTMYEGTIFYKSKPRRVAISRRYTGSLEGATEFHKEVEVHSKVRHRNVAPLIGYCTDNDERILVYEYMPNGSLDKHLYGGGYPLSWTQRLEICIDIAQGLDYLHTCSPIQQGIIHRDVKSSNIMVGDNWEAKISGLALCRIANENESLSHVSTQIAGTMGYIDAEYFRTGILTSKSDVYSFGVVLCEVLCGRKSIDVSFITEERSLVKYFQHHLKERRMLDEIIDPRLHGQIQPNCLDAFVQIVDQCLLETREERPAMAEVLARLESLMSLQQKPYVYDVEGEATTGFGSLETSSVWAHNKQEIVHYSSELEAPSDGNSLHYEETEANSNPEDSAVIRREGSSVWASGKQESIVYSTELEAPSDGDGLHHEEIDQSISNPRSWSVPRTPSFNNIKKRKTQQFLSGFTKFLSGMKLRKYKWKPSTSASLWHKEHIINKEGTSTHFETDSEHIDQVMQEEVDSEDKDEEHLSPSQKNVSADVIQLEGLKLTEMPQVEEWNAREIHLCDNELSGLPEKPYCPILVKLDLQLNYNIGVIPLAFFDQMPGLRVLDLSKTSIKYLPPSVSKLVALREFYMRDCPLLMELPTEIGALKSLRVFDFEGTELTYLPKEMGMLHKLEILKVSLYQHAHHFRGSRQISEIISAAMLSKFSRLKVLSIDVAPDCDWWETEATHIVEMLSDLKNLHTLKFYFPSVELLYGFIGTQHSVYPLLSHFRLIVGRYEPRMISRFPFGLVEVFMKLDKCIKYTNDGGTPDVIAKALKHASALYLERNWTIQSLSIFKMDEMETLKSCLLVECNEMQSIVNGSEFHEEEDNRGKVFDRRAVLGSLQYLSIHYMKNLDCIWRGPFRYGSLCCLKILEIYACPELTTIFTKELLYGLTNLEHLTVEDCAKLDSLVSLGSYYPESGHFLPKLKRLCLLDLPELFSISRGIFIAPDLERMVIYNCPMLRGLSTKEVSSSKIEAVNGEIEWWDALEWCEPEWSSGRPDYLAHVFVPLARDEGLIDQFTTDLHLLQQLM